MSDHSFNAENNPVGAIAYVKSLEPQDATKKIELISGECQAYLSSPVLSKKFIETLADQGNDSAIHLKLEGLSEGRDGFEKNLESARDFNETWVNQGHEEAIGRKIEGLLMGTNGYQQNPDQVAPTIEVLIANEKAQRIGHTLKALGMKYGILGFKRDNKAANEYIRAHYVGY
jgi:hypothetical protein